MGGWVFDVHLGRGHPTGHDVVRVHLTEKGITKAGISE